MVASAKDTDQRQLVLAVAALMITAQVAFRAWALYPSWFYGDDYVLLIEAKRGLGEGYLLRPFNGHLMPGGRLLAWLIGDSGHLNWTLAATSTLAFQLLAALAALWMLVTLFGTRPGILFPLAFYLFSIVTLPAQMWWAASLTQQLMQPAFFLAVAAWIRYLRTQRTRWLVLVLLTQAVALAFDVKALLIAPVLLFLALGYFAEGSVLARARQVLAEHWRALVLGAAMLSLYVAYYVAHVDQPFSRPGLGLLSDLANTMVGTAFTTALLGGPWHWSVPDPPNASAAPPSAQIHLAWLVIAIIVLYGFLRRERTLRAWALSAGYVLVLLGLLYTSRADAYGAGIGLQYRFLTDAACAVTLTLGLVFMRLRVAPESSRRRPRPMLTVGLSRIAAGALCLALVASGLVSSVQYVHIWHTRNASDAFMHNLSSDLRRVGAVDLVDQPVPGSIVSPLSAPSNGLRQVLSLLGQRASFPEVTPDLAVVASDGSVHKALIQTAVVSEPGPVQDCGWRVGTADVTIPLKSRAFTWQWWVRIGYLANGSSPMVITAGGDEIRTDVSPGIHSLYLQVDAGFETVTINGLAPGTTVCVDTIEVGQPVPGGAL